MGFLGKLFGLGAVAGVAVAAVKVAQKYEENKNIQAENAAQAAAENAAFMPEDESVLDDVKKAATDVYKQTSDKVIDTVKDVAQKAGVNTDEVAQALGDAGKALAEAGKAVVNKVQEEAPAAIEKAKEKASEVIAQVKETVAGATVEVYEFADDIDEIVLEPQEPAELTSDEIFKQIQEDLAQTDETVL